MKFWQLSGVEVSFFRETKKVYVYLCRPRRRRKIRTFSRCEYADSWPGAISKVPREAITICYRSPRSKRCAGVQRTCRRAAAENLPHSPRENKEFSRSVNPVLATVSGLTGLPIRPGISPRDRRFSGRLEAGARQAVQLSWPQRRQNATRKPYSENKTRELPPRPCSCEAQQK